MLKNKGTLGHDHHDAHHGDGFPRRGVFILVFCVSVNVYTLVNLFPYVGIMVKQMMGLESINESGKAALMFDSIKWRACLHW